MKQCLSIGCLFLGLVTMALVGCVTSPDSLSEEEKLSQDALVEIDSLMWHQPDSALAVMLEFAASPMADSLDAFNGHYCQLLIAELLFKNDYGQSNRAEVLKAVHYFDSIVGMDGADTRGRGRIILMVRATMSATASLRLAGNTSMPCG